MKHKKLIWDSKKVSKAIEAMLNTLSEEYPISSKGIGLELSFCEGARGLEISKDSDRANVVYGSISDAARAVGRLNF